MIATLSAINRTRATEIADQVRAAHEARRPLRIVGAGTWIERGAPVDASTSISCATHHDIVDYVPGDFTITVGAGTPLSKIEGVAAANGQWLTLDPFGSREGTIGATIATASAGPLATGFGTPRDLVLGIEAVTGTGDIIRAGGRVVKNVAGFDLARLFTGSRGTLGMVTEVSLRLRARPAKDETIAITVGDRANGIRDISRVLRTWPFTPMAAEVIDAVCAELLGFQKATTLLLRLGGNARAVASQKKRAAALGKATAVENGIWSQLREVESSFAGVFRVSDLPTSFADRWDDLRQLSGPSGLVHGSPARGTLRCAMREIDRQRIAAFRSRTKSAVVLFETLPSVAMWNALTVEPDPGSLQARVRAAFDPSGIMNPGAVRLAR